jgi:hypothetical protein
VADCVASSGRLAGVAAVLGIRADAMTLAAKAASRTKILEVAWCRGRVLSFGRRAVHGCRCSVGSGVRPCLRPAGSPLSSQ